MMKATFYNFFINGLLSWGFGAYVRTKILDLTTMFLCYVKLTCTSKTIPPETIVTWTFVRTLSIGTRSIWVTNRFWALVNIWKENRIGIMHGCSLHEVIIFTHYPSPVSELVDPAAKGSNACKCAEKILSRWPSLGMFNGYDHTLEKQLPPFPCPLVH